MKTATLMDHTEHHTRQRPTVTDPVCGMTVDPATAAGSSSYRGETHDFCSLRCKQTFDENPDSFVGPTNRTVPSAHPASGDNGHGHHSAKSSLNRVAFSATVHCLTGCATGEVLGLLIGTALGWSTWPTIALAVGLAFLFGYLFTLIPLVRSGLTFRAALGVALASDTASIAIMEVVDNGVMLVIPGAMTAGLASPVFWTSLAIALVVAGAAAYPVNRWLIARGRGHALVHQFHGQHQKAAGQAHGGYQSAHHGRH